MKNLLFVVAVVFHCLLVRDVAAQQCPDDVPAGITFQCLNCNTALLCSEGLPDALATLECDAGTACVSGETACVGVDVDVVEGLDGLGTNECGCLDELDAPQAGTFPDPYSNASYVECDASGKPTYSSCEAGETFNGAACAPPAECPDNFFGSIAVEGDCSSYVNCGLDGDTSSGKCQDGEVFDYAFQGCVPEFTCVGMADGEYPEPLKCNMFHFCILEADNPHCCPLGLSYDSVSKKCIAQDEADCSRTYLNKCTETEYETAACGYCAAYEAGYTYYTTLGACSPLYYKCNEGGSSVLTECAEGTVFQSDTQLCESLDAHPECE